MSFRDATMDDAPLLYRWRREHEVGGWYRKPPTSFHQHSHWLAQRIDNPLVEVLIWEEDGASMGSVRIDSNGELAFDAHIGCDVGAMLKAAAVYARFYGGRLKANVDDNDPRAAFLERAGFSEYPVRFLAYKT